MNEKHRSTVIGRGILVLLLVVFITGSVWCLFALQGFASEQTKNLPKFKVLHIMSYHSSWPWNIDQFNGFKDALKGIEIEYRVFEMDTKRNSSAEWMTKMGRQARDLIVEWEPDLVYVNDDNAQKYITKYF